MTLRPSATALAVLATALTLPTAAGAADPAPTPPPTPPAPTTTPGPIPPGGITPGSHLADLKYQCKVPLLGLKRGQMRWFTQMPATVLGGATDVSATMLTDIALQDVGGFMEPWDQLGTWEGTAGFNVVTTGSTGTERRQRVTMPLPSREHFYGTASFSAVFSGSPSLKVQTDAQGGYHVARLESVTLNLLVRDKSGVPVSLPPLTTDVDGNPVTDSDGDPNTFDVYCKLDPADQDARLAATNATRLITPVPPPTARYRYTLQGSTTLNTLTKGSMPLTGSVDATLTLSTGDVSAALQLNDTQGRLTALGFLPVTATVGFVPSGPTTGKLVDDQLTTSSKVRIKVRSVKAFGAIPLAGGNDCQSKSLSTINLASTDAFDPTGTGGTLAGTYAISDLNGCGPLGGLVSPLTAGSGNTISVKLTPIAP